MDTKRKLIEEYLQDENRTLFADGFDDAILGITVGIASRDVVAYDYDKCVDILVEKHAMTHEDAVEYLDYNTISCWLGEYTPIFVKSCSALD